MGKYLTYFDKHDSYIEPSKAYNNISFCNEENELHWNIGSEYLKAALKSLYDKGLIESPYDLTLEEKKYIYYNENKGLIITNSGNNCGINDELSEEYIRVFNLKDYSNIHSSYNNLILYFDYDNHTWRNLGVRNTSPEYHTVGNEYLVVIGQYCKNDTYAETDIYKDLLETLPEE